MERFLSPKEFTKDNLGWVANLPIWSIWLMHCSQALWKNGHSSSCFSQHAWHLSGSVTGTWISIAPSIAQTWGARDELIETVRSPKFYQKHQVAKGSMKASGKFMDPWCSMFGLSELIGLRIIGNSTHDSWHLFRLKMGENTSQKDKKECDKTQK